VFGAAVGVGVGVGVVVGRGVLVPVVNVGVVGLTPLILVGKKRAGTLGNIQLLTSDFLRFPPPSIDKLEKAMMTIIN
jgi:hypothetical protein